MAQLGGDLERGARHAADGGEGGGVGAGAEEAADNGGVAVRRGGGAGVALDFERAAPLLSRAGVSAPEVAADPFLDGARTLVRPERLASTRDLEAPVWPKVLHFAEVLANLPDDAARRERFGEVPVRRLANGAWAAGSRHRAAAARLCGLALACRVVKKGS